MGFLFGWSVWGFFPILCEYSLVLRALDQIQIHFQLWGSFGEETYGSGIRNIFVSFTIIKTSSPFSTQVVKLVNVCFYICTF